MFAVALRQAYEILGKILVKNIRIYAHHGCLKEETLIGSDYRVDVWIRANLEKAAATDHISDTVDYVHLNKIVKTEMMVPSKLLEHVARRISERIFSELPTVEKIGITLSKLNPPIEGDVEMVSVKLRFNR